jgi:hypothetical protein
MCHSEFTVPRREEGGGVDHTRRRFKVQEEESTLRKDLNSDFE